MINGDPWLKMFDFLCIELEAKGRFDVEDCGKIADDDTWW